MSWMLSIPIHLMLPISFSMRCRSLGPITTSITSECFFHGKLRFQLESFRDKRWFHERHCAGTMRAYLAREALISRSSLLGRHRANSATHTSNLTVKLNAKLTLGS